MAEGHANMHGESELDAVTGTPELNHGCQVLFQVLLVLGATICQPDGGVPRVSTHKLLDRVVGRKVNHGQMYRNVKQHHLGGIQHASLIFDLLSQGELRKAVHGREPLSILVHHEPKY